MKWFVIVALFALTTCEDELLPYFDPAANCEEGPVYAGRLALKGICMNYVITLEGEVPEGWIENNYIDPSWTHPYSEVVYTNSFRLGSVCDFPESIKEGDLFYFTASVEPFNEQQCAVCEAYSPTPQPTLFLNVCEN